MTTFNDSSPIIITPDASASAGMDGSAFWECVTRTASTIIDTLPRCGSSSLVNESQALRKELGRLVGIMERASMPLVQLDPPNANPELPQ